MIKSNGKKLAERFIEEFKKMNLEIQMQKKFSEELNESLKGTKLSEDWAETYREQASRWGKKSNL